MTRTLRNKTLVTLTAIGALALPVGVVAAQSDDTTPTEPTTTILQEQDRDRDRLHDGTCDADGEQVQARLREQVHVEDGVGPMARERHEGDQSDFDGSEQGGDRLRLHDQLHDGTGEQARHGR